MNWPKAWDDARQKVGLSVEQFAALLDEIQAEHLPILTQHQRIYLSLLNADTDAAAYYASLYPDALTSTR
jgi:hypothetical protein